MTPLKELKSKPQNQIRNYSIMLYTLNLYRAVCQLSLNKAEKNLQYIEPREVLYPGYIKNYSHKKKK